MPTKRIPKSANVTPRQIQALAKVILYKQINNLEGIDELVDEVRSNYFSHISTLTDEEKTKIQESWEKQICTVLDKLSIL